MYQPLNSNTYTYLANQFDDKAVVFNEKQEMNRRKLYFDDY